MGDGELMDEFVNAVNLEYDADDYHQSGYVRIHQANESDLLDFLSAKRWTHVRKDSVIQGLEYLAW